MKLFQFLSISSLFYGFLKVSPDEKYYPGVNSLKKVKVSPPRQGNMYPDLTENFFNERPDTAMSEEVIKRVLHAPEVDFRTGSSISRNFSCQNTMCRHLTIFLQFQSVAPSEAPSLGTAIQKLSKSKSPAMKPIAEDKDKDYMVTQKVLKLYFFITDKSRFKKDVGHT